MPSQKGFIKFTKRTLVSYLIISIVFFGTGLIYLFNPFGTTTADAAWFNDNWAYRKEIPITANASADTDAFFSFTLDTATLITAGQLQSSCQDIRVTDVNGNILQYHVGRTNACNNAATTIDTLPSYASNSSTPTLPAGASTFYVYYGNPSAISADRGSNFTQSEAASYTVGTLGSAVSGPAPTLYWKFDDAQGTNADDSTTNALDGTLNNTPTWQTENFCIAGKCLYFDGANNENVSKADDSKLDFVAADNFTVSAWVKRNGASSAVNYIINKTALEVDGDRGYTLYMDASGDLCFETSYGAGPSVPDTACTSAVDFDDNGWHFVSGVKAGTTSITLFVDGNQRAQDSSLSSSTLANSGSFYAGVYRDGTSNEWLGFIDEIKVTRDQTARTAAQVLADYNARSNPEGVSQQLGNNTQNMPSTLSNGLVGYWKMDESSWTSNCSTTEVTDSSGNANNGISCPTGDANDPLAGKFGNAGDFDGTNDYVQIADNAVFDSANVAVSAWVKLDSIASNQYLVTHLHHSNGEGYGLDYKQSTGLFEFRVYDGTNSSEIAAPGTGVTAATGVWYHLIGTYDGSSVKMYVNGVLRGTASSTNPIDYTTSVPVRIGRSSDSSTNYTNGLIDEARIYNRALSSTEVSQLYNWAPGPIGYWKMDEGSWTNDCSTDSVLDSSGNGLNGDACPSSTGPTGGNAGKYNKAGKFDGSDDYLDLSNPTILTSAQTGTISTWINFSSTASGQSFISYGGGAATNAGGLRITSSGTTLFVVQSSNGEATSNTLSAGSVITAGTWQHISLTSDGSTFRFYVNGREVSLGVSSGSNNGNWFADTTLSGTTRVVLGSAYLNGAFALRYSGSLDDTKVYNYPRTQAQIIEDMNANHPAPGSPLSSTVATWKLDEGYGTSAQDWSGNANTLTLSTATSSWTNSGKFLKAFSGAGTRWMSRADDADFDIAATDSFAISMWYRSDSGTDPAATEYLIAKGPLSAAGYALYANTDGTVCFGIDDDATWNPNVSTCTATDFYDGNWHHVVGVRNTVTDTISIYIDGHLKDSDTDTTSATLANSSSLYIADVNGTDNGNEFVGSVDEIKFYRSALTASQVSLDMNRSSSEVLGAVSDSSTAGNDNASTRTTQSAASQYCIPGDSTTCTGPVGEWNLDEGSGTSANDSSGNANTGTITAGTGSYVNGKVNKAYSFDSANTIINAGSGTTLDDMAGITLEAWIYPKSVGEGSNAFIVNKNLGNTQSAGWIFHYTSNNGLLFVVDGTTDMVRQSSNSVVPLNRWSHVAMSWTGTIGTATTARLFVNGKETSYQTTTNGASRVSDAARSLYIGNASSQDRTFDGFIDQVKVFNYGRTPAQIAWDYNQGKPIAHWKIDECQGTVINDMSGFSNTGTLTIGATGTYTTPGTCSTSSASSAWYNGATGKRNYSMAFDGTDDYITMGDVLDFEYTSPFTISTWVKTSTATPTSAQRLVSKTEAVSGVPGYLLGIRGDQSGDPYEFELRTTTSALSINFPRPSDTNWQHVVVAYTFNNTGTWADVVPGVKAYVNGVPATITDVSNGNPGSTTVNAGPFNIGTRNNGTQPFAGQIDDTKIFNYQLTATQVKSLYNDGATRYGPVTGAP